ncbi:hypothetical protein [Priestia megaterium]|uniref:hypothetical protein n=1 Tax=Priestia megaterium TaxID=1404 RepID=UPI0025A3B57D|nr:hypothetical protein [Priestia megaterium]MDM8148634.1 hypothetical protein [Priestia megaterium]
MPRKLGKLLGIDPIMGRSGTEGFNQESPIIKQNSSSIFTHNNVIRRDFISNKWIPFFLEANKNSLWDENMKRIKREAISTYRKGHVN